MTRRSWAGPHAWLEPGLLVIATLAAFLPGIFGHFVGWDDDRNFLWNESWRGLGPRQLAWMFTAFHMSLYIPVTWLTLGFDYLAWGMNPVGYHLTSLLLHAATAVAVLALARRLLRLALPADVDPVARRVGAFAAALLFAVHPLRVESVVWITERRDVVSGLFYVGTVLAYLRAVEGGDPRARGRRAWYGASIGLFALAVFSKPLVVTLPVVLLLLDAWPLRRFAGPDRPRAVGRAVVEKIPLLILSAAGSLLTVLAAGAAGNARSLSGFGIADRLIVSLYGLAFYLWKTVVPVRLSPMYELSELQTGSARLLIAAGALFVAGSAVLAGLRRSRPVAGVAAAYVVTLAPVIGIVQNGPQAAADRYSYLGCLGWAVLAGAALALLLRRWSAGAHRVRVAGLLGGGTAAVIVLAGLTAWQTLVWHDSLTLWARALELDRDSAIAHTNYGTALAQADRIEEAAPHLERAVELDRRLPEAFMGLAYVRMVQKRPSEAIALAESAVRLRPRDVRPRVVFGGILRELGDLERALAAFRSSLALAPTSATYYEIALTLARLGRSTEAEAALAEGRALARRRDLDERDADRYAALVYMTSDPIRAAQAWERYLRAMATLRNPTAFDVGRIVEAMRALDELRSGRPAS